MKLTEGKIKEAQEIIEAVMVECGFYSANIFSDGTAACCINDSWHYAAGKSLADVYINRLHELNGTQAPLF